MERCFRSSEIWIEKNGATDGRVIMLRKVLFSYNEGELKLSSFKKDARAPLKNQQVIQLAYAIYSKFAKVKL